MKIMRYIKEKYIDIFLSIKISLIMSIYKYCNNYVPKINDMRGTEMKDQKIRCTPEPTLRRLPLYLGYLKGIETAGQNISCTQIAKEFGFDPTQVRKDIAETGIIGTARVGYNVQELRLKIEAFLGWNKPNEAFLVGAGNLGTALLKYSLFKDKYGLNIVAVFDDDKAKHGAYIAGKQIFPVEKITDLASRMHVPIGIIAIPPEEAQSVADQMVEGGIKGIWNFAPVALKVPEDVVVENARLSTSLAVLTGKLNKMLSI